MRKALSLACFIAAMLALPGLAPAQIPSYSAEDLQAAITRAEEYRRKAAYFDGAAYFPSEWEAAETRYAEARNMPTTSVIETNQAATTFTLAADSFASIFRLSVFLYAQAREDEIMMIRDRLVAAGARAIFPSLMAPADQIALAALGQYEASDYHAARDLAAQAYAMFQTLETAFDAWQMRREIIQRGFTSYAASNYTAAEEMIAAAVHAYLAGEFPRAMENAKEAQARYSLVLSAGWAAVADYHYTSADTERIAAMEVRANIAASGLFEQAESIRNEAIELLHAERFREAAQQLADAEALYLVARVSTLESRRIAAEAIRKANRQIEEAINAAQRASINEN